MLLTIFVHLYSREVEEEEYEYPILGKFHI